MANGEGRRITAPPSGAEGAASGADDELILYFEHMAALAGIRRGVRRIAVAVSCVMAVMLAIFAVTCWSGGKPVGQSVITLSAAGCILVIAIIAAVRQSPRWGIVLGLSIICVLGVAVVRGMNVGKGAEIASCLVYVSVIAVLLGRLWQWHGAHERLMACKWSGQILEETKKLLQSVAESKPDADTRAVQMRIVTWIDRHYYRGLLLGDVAVFVLANRRGAFAARRGDISLALEGRGRIRRGKMGVKGREFRVEMDGESHRRIALWNEGRLSAHGSEAVSDN